MSVKSQIAAGLLLVGAATSCGDGQKSKKNFMSIETAIEVYQPDSATMIVNTYHPRSETHVHLADTLVHDRDDVKQGWKQEGQHYAALDAFTKHAVDFGLKEIKIHPSIEKKIDFGQALGDFFGVERKVEKPVQQAELAPTH